MIDAQFLYKGAKGARGGKAKFNFKHEKKRKHRRYDQRKRLGTRQNEYDLGLQLPRPKYVAILDC